MSRIADLVQKYAPDGVEHKVLGDVAKVFRGKRFVKADMVESGVPCIHYGEVYTKYGLSATTSYSFLDPEQAVNLRFANPGDLVVATAGETVDDIGNGVAWLGADPVVIHDACYAVRSDVLDPTYLSYLFRTNAFKDQIRMWISSSKISSISTQNLARAVVPVPPLEFQREIVRILNSFTDLEADLEAELEAELESRRQQYAHYRDALLAFSNGEAVQWLPMSEFGTFTRGRRFTKNDMVAEGIPSIHYGEIYTHYGVSATKTLSNVREEIGNTLRYAKPNDVVIAGVGETVVDVAKAVAWLGDTEVAIHDDSYAFRSEADPTYISYVMQTAAFHAQKEKYVARAKVKRIGGESLGRIVVPVPPIDEQRRIVAILDRFDALVRDLSSRLPAEIEARRKQYAYYRDQLLSFEGVAA